jgi:hypothetical protein
VAEAAQKREEGALNVPSPKRLARDGGRAQFAPSTLTCSCHGRAYGGALIFFANRRRMSGLICAEFRPQPTNQRLFCWSGRDKDLLELLLCVIQYQTASDQESPFSFQKRTYTLLNSRLHFRSTQNGLPLNEFNNFHHNTLRKSCILFV